MSIKEAKPDLNEAGFFKSVEDFTAFSKGDHAIQKILIANNGIGATKAIRSIRRWSFETFGNERMVNIIVSLLNMVADAKILPRKEHSLNTL